MVSGSCSGSSPHSPVVQGALSGAFTVLLKRGWLAGSDAQQAWLGDVEGMAVSGQDPVIRCTSIQLLEVSMVEH